MITNDKCWLKDNCNHIDCNNFCPRLYKLNELYDNAFIPLKLRKHIKLFIDSDGTDKEAFSQLKNIENNIVDNINNGKSIYIYSSQVGNGKTSWALRLVESYFNTIWTKSTLGCKALFINVPNFMLELKSNISNKSETTEYKLKNIKECDVVIFDEIGTKGLTSYEHENLLSIIDTRINNGKANIFTSNLDLDKLKSVVGDRLYSRITKDYIIQFKGKDKRGVI